MALLKSASSAQTAGFQGARRQRRNATGITRCTARCIAATPAKGSSTTQSISAAGHLRAVSLTAGQ
jgi:hypothetical protein